MNSDLPQKNKKNDDFQIIDFSSIKNFFSRFKYVLLVFPLLGIIFASIYLQQAKYTYTVSLNLVPISPTGNNANFSSSLGVVSSLLGINTTRSKNENFELYKIVIFSNLLAKKLSNEPSFIKLILGDMYDQDKQELNLLLKETFLKLKIL